MEPETELRFDRIVLAPAVPALVVLGSTMVITALYAVGVLAIESTRDIDTQGAYDFAYFVLAAGCCAALLLLVRPSLRALRWTFRFRVPWIRVRLCGENGEIEIVLSSRRQNARVSDATVTLWALNEEGEERFLIPVHIASGSSAGSCRLLARLDGAIVNALKGGRRVRCGVAIGPRSEETECLLEAKGLVAGE